MRFRILSNESLRNHYVEKIVEPCLARQEAELTNDEDWLREKERISRLVENELYSKIHEREESVKNKSNISHVVVLEEFGTFVLTILYEEWEEVPKSIGKNFEIVF